MKYVALTILFVTFSVQQRNAMVGVYKIQYDKTIGMLDCTITFADSVYVMKSHRGFPVNGKIKQEGNHTYLEGNIYPNLLINFKTQDIKKDTIRFQVHDKHGSGSYMHFSVNSGKLIKIK